MVQLLENSTEGPQKIKHRTDPAILLLGTHPTELKAVTRRETCTPMFTAALFATAKVGGNPGVHGRMMDKHRVVSHTTEYYLVLKRKKF